MGLYQITKQEAFLVRGISIRTNNAAELSGRGQMKGLWDRFKEENLVEKIPQVVDAHKVFVVYSDYESDENGDYTYTIGYKVPPTSSPVADFSDALVEPGSFAVVPSGKGSIPEIIISAWQTIWALSPEELGGKRAYVADFEVYDSRCADPQNAQVDICLSLKSET